MGRKGPGRRGHLNAGVFTGPGSPGPEPAVPGKVQNRSGPGHKAPACLRTRWNPRVPGSTCTHGPGVHMLPQGLCPNRTMHLCSDARTPRAMELHAPPGAGQEQTRRTPRKPGSAASRGSGGRGRRRSGTPRRVLTGNRHAARDANQAAARGRPGPRGPRQAPGLGTPPLIHTDCTLCTYTVLIMSK